MASWSAVRCDIEMSDEGDITGAKSYHGDSLGDINELRSDHNVQEVQGREFYDAGWARS